MRVVRALAVLVAAFVLPAPLAAHTTLQWARPADGDTVTGSPAELRVRFTTSVQAQYTRLWLDEDPGALGEPVAHDGDREFAAAVLSSLAPGEYTGRWRTVAADGHVMEGRFTFTVAADPAAPAPAPEPRAAAPGPAEPPAAARGPPPEVPAWAEPGSAVAAAVRFGQFTGLILLLGAVAFRLGVLPGAGPLPGAAGRVAGLAALGLGLVAVAAVLRLWLQSVALHGAEAAWDPDSLSGLLRGTGWGWAWLLQAAAVPLAAAGLLAARWRPGRRPWIAVAVGALALATVPALTGHAAAATSPAWPGVANDSLHVAAAGVWIGMLAALLFAGLPAALGTPPPERNARAAALVNRFSPVALAAGGLVAFTGIVNAVLQIPTFADLWGTAYGRTLLLKLAVLVPVFATGFYNWRYVRPALSSDAGPPRLRRSAGVELAVGALAIAVTAVLVALPRP